MAATMDSWPRLQNVLQCAGINADPTALVALVTGKNNQDVTTAIQAVFTTLEEAVAHQTNTTESEIATLQAQKSALQETLALKGPENTTSSNGRRISDDPEKFGGTEKDIAKRQQQYVTWRSQLQRCFSMDAQVFHSDFRRIQHIASLLKDDAYDIHREQFETITENPDDPSQWHWHTHQDVFKTLNEQYSTLDLSRQATIDLDNLWMANKPFQNFIAEFNKYATKSGKTKAQKVELLKAKVSQELADLITGIRDKPGREDFDGWSKLFQDLYQDLQEKAHLDKIRNNRPGARRPQPPPTTSSTTTTFTTSAFSTPVQDVGDPMVLDAARAGPRPTKEQCVAQNLCFYCKKPGHNKLNCEERKRNNERFGTTPNSQYQGTADAVARPFQQPYQQSRRFNQQHQTFNFPQRQPIQYSPQTFNFPQRQAIQYSRQFGNAPYHMRTMDNSGGYIEGEVASSVGSTTLGSHNSRAHTPASTVSPSMSASNVDHLPGNV